MPKPGALSAPVTDIVRQQTYFDVNLRADGIVWLERNAQVYTKLRDVHCAYDEFLREVDNWLLERRMKRGKLGTTAPSPMAWLVDIRSAPSRRNDAEFENAVEERRKDLLQRSPLLAILVRTASGKMQLTRMARDGGAKLMIFDDFAGAVAALRAAMTEAFGE
jgi:hypothetical protein